MLRRYLSAYKEILCLGAPILVGQLGNITVGFADNIMVGRYSTDALASSAFVNNVFNVAILACIGFSYGLTPIVGAMFARGEKERIGAVVRNCLRVNAIFTLLVMALMAIAYFNIHRMGQPEHLLPLIRPYFLIFLAGMLPVSVFNVFAQWSYSVGDTRHPTWIILGANALNILGNYLLIYGHFGFPELGLTGAGISTFMARIVCAASIFLFFARARRNAVYRVSFRGVRLKMRELRTIVVTGFPVSMQMACETAAFSGAAVMAGWLGAVSLAAFQIIVVTGTLGFCIYYSIGAAVAVLVAHRAGQADAPGMRHVAWSGYHVLLVVMSLSSLTFIFFGRSLMGLFSDDPVVVSVAAGLIFPLVLYQVADATQINFANALRGTGHVMPMLYIAFFSYIVAGLPATYLIAFPCGLGIYGIILSFSVSLLMAAVLFFVFFMRASRSRRPIPES